MKLVLTEICDDTGSWLRDVDPNIEKDILSNMFPFVGNKLLVSSLKKYGMEDSIIKKLNSKYVLVRYRSKIERTVSYQLHTNRELNLFIDNKKDFAVFSRHISEKYNIYNNQKFKKFKKLIRSKTYTFNNIKYVFKFLPKSEWKVEAYKLLIRVRSYTGNSSHLECIEGELLGYTQDQNLEYVNSFLNQHKAE